MQQNIALKVIIDSFLNLMVMMMREQVFWDNQKYTLKDKPGTDLKNSAKLVKDWCNYWKLVSGSRSALSEKCDERMGSRRLRK